MSTAIRIKLVSIAIACTMLVGVLASPASAADAPKVRLVLDWAWVPHHSAFLMAQARGYYSDAGLDVSIEQGRGSNTTALLVGQGKFDIGHLNITNAAHAISKGMALKVVAIYQHRSAASFVGISGRVKLDGPQSLKGVKIGSTAGGSDQLSLAIFTTANNMAKSDLNIITLEGSTKRAALISGQVDVVSGDYYAYTALVRSKGHKAESLLLSDFGVPLIGFGFAVHEPFLQANPEVVRKFLQATKRGFQDAAADPRAACEFTQKTVLLPGTIDYCADFITSLLKLSTPPTSEEWGHQSEEEWENLVSTLRSVGQIKNDMPATDYYTTAVEPE